MTTDDERLGMHRDITRRDFLNGAALTIGALAGGLAPTAGAQTPYPPALTGMRGHHAGSFEVMHAIRDGTFWQSAGTPERVAEHYDLIVVGAGISGLSAAFLHRQHARGKILILDNHDDFGGHAKRNEFVASNGRWLLGHGGSQSLQSPSFFSPAVKQLLRDVGVDTESFHRFYDSEWFEQRGLGEAVFFRKESFGKDAFLNITKRAGDWISRAPFSTKTKQRLIELYDAPRNYLPGRSRTQKLAVLERFTYAEFLTRIVGLDAEVLPLFQHTTEGSFGIGVDGTTCLDAYANGNPGFDGMDLGDAVHPSMSPTGRLLMKDPDPYIFHFPDGNAGVARALVRALIPDALPGSDMESLVTSKLDYARLDRSRSDVRMRLSSPVVRVKHTGDPKTATTVEVTYVQDGKLKSVSADRVVLACWHRVIPLITDELERVQIDALNDQQKVPLIYTNVLLRNWEAFAKLGIREFSAPGAFWPEVTIDFPVSMGSYRFAQTPSDPVVLHLPKIILDAAPGRSEREQARLGRHRLTTLTFEQMEREIRDLLARALSMGGFDPARHIEAITVNRWSHGYAYEYMRPWDAYWPNGPLPIETARKPWGRIAIANADSGAYAYAHSAIDQAARAIKELLGERAHGIADHSTFPGPPLSSLF